MSDGFDSAQAFYDAQEPFDSDDIDSFDFDRLTNAISETQDDLSCCDLEHVKSLKRRLLKLQDELADL
jgi:hypothetical protein